MPKTEVDELKDIFKEHGDQNSLPIRDVPANTELKQVFCRGQIMFFLLISMLALLVSKLGPVTDYFGPNSVSSCLKFRPVSKSSV